MIAKTYRFRKKVESIASLISFKSILTSTTLIKQVTKIH